MASQLVGDIAQQLCIVLAIALSLLPRCIALQVILALVIASLRRWWRPCVDVMASSS
jgi:hypothetical protein